MNIEIIINEEKLLEAFPGWSFPFNLKKDIKNIVKHEGLEYIAQELVAYIKSNPELKGRTLLTSNAIKTCGVHKIRIKKDNNQGKSKGYRVIFLLITPYAKGYVLDITDHSMQDDLTDAQKAFCNKLVNELDQTIKNTK